MPLINRGTALRTTAINTLIHQFIQKYSKIQILSLGAGFDTRVFYLQDSKISYWEIDVPMVVSKKIMIIQKSKNLSDKIPDFKVEDGNLKSSHYTLISGDLKDFESIKGKLLNFGFDAQIPTLILSECLLIYLEVEKSTCLIQEFRNLIQDCAFIVYEQVHIFKN